MAICFNCKEEYIAYDSDAGTYKEHFCSEECATEMDDAIVEYERSLNE